MLVNSINKNQKIYKLLSNLIIIGIIFFISLSVFNFLNSNFSEDINNDNCENFINPTIKYQDKFQIIEKDVYVFPEIKNLLCLNKIINSEIEENINFITVGTNSKIVNLIITISFTFLYLFSLKNKLSTVIKTYTIFVFGLSYNFFFSLNFHSFNLFLFFTFLLINKFFIDNYEGIFVTNKETINFKLINVFLFIFYFIFLTLTQFSTHNIETMDWDINSFIVTSMDFQNGNIPFEVHYENKPPLLFLNYFIFLKIANGSLLNIKILNDILLFIIVLLLHFTILKKTKKLYLSSFCSIIFIVLMSKDWFHPGYSELHSLFYLALGIYFFESKLKQRNIALAGIFFSFATLCNLGAVIFIVPFLVSLFLNQKKIDSLFVFLLSFSIPHLILLTLYSLRGLLNNYIVSMITIPRNYPRLGSDAIYELGIFIEEINNFSTFINIMIIFIFSRVFSHIFINNNLPNLLKDSSLLFLLFSLLFYLLASIGYQHHLIFIIFFISSSGIYLIKKLDFYILIPILFFSIMNIGIQQFSDSIENIKNYETLEKQYPLFKASQIYFDEILYEDTLLSFDNYLILYHLNKNNVSYISHPALYEEKFVLEPLSELNLVNLNEIESSINKLPSFIICSNLIEFCDKFENYELINTEEVNNLDFHYYQMEKKLKLFKLNN
jgi:hypothetical protein